MKRIIAILLCIASILCVAACGDSSKSTGTSPTLSGGSCILYAPGYHNGIKYEDVEYLTLEEMCAKVDYIVVVTYANRSEYNDIYDKHTFCVKESIWGDLSGEIEVYVKSEKNKDYRVMINGKEHFFCEDTFGINSITDEIMLFLTLEENLPGVSSPQYIWRGAPFIYLSNLKESSMYNELISKHITGFDFDNASREEVVAYIKSLVADRTEN